MIIPNNYDLAELSEYVLRCKELMEDEQTFIQSLDTLKECGDIGEYEINVINNIFADTDEEVTTQHLDELILQIHIKMADSF